MTKTMLNQETKDVYAYLERKKGTIVAKEVHRYLTKHQVIVTKEKNGYVIKNNRDDITIPDYVVRYIISIFNRK